MKVPDNFYLLFQPKYRVPSVFDLHDKGWFKKQPFVTKYFGFRIIVNAEFKAKLQLVQLLCHKGTDVETGQKYSFITKQTLIPLRPGLGLYMAKIKRSIRDESVLGEVMEIYKRWYDAFVPMNSKGKIDQGELRRKLEIAISEERKRLGKKIMRKNKCWIEPAIPRLIDEFKKGLYLRMNDELYHAYKEIGGEDTEDGLIRKILLFYRIYETQGEQGLLKPNGQNWYGEDEIWDCWVAFSGSESEAKRVCVTMNTVMRPLQAII